MIQEQDGGESYFDNRSVVEVFFLALTSLSCDSKFHIVGILTNGNTKKVILR